MKAESNLNMNVSKAGPTFTFGHRCVRFFLQLSLRAYLFLMGGIKVVGVENIPSKGALIFASNHVSNLDPLVGWYVGSRFRLLRGIAKEELWANPVIGYCMDALGGVKVKRGTADRNMLRTALQVLDSGEAIGIFPEGTRSRDGSLQPLQHGFALLAEKSSAVVLPTVIVGTFEMLPPGKKYPKRSTITIIFGKPIQPGNTTRQQLVDKVEVEMRRMLSEFGPPYSSVPSKICQESLDATHPA